MGVVLKFPLKRKRRAAHARQVNRTGEESGGVHGFERLGLIVERDVIAPLMKRI